ncbi:MAG: hypothetical protein IPK82_07430 [Polyangiaceae bacterium]|nr:hypothetical protein [Polyangiaceae bacterium]
MKLIRGVRYRGARWAAVFALCAATGAVPALAIAQPKPAASAAKAATSNEVEGTVLTLDKDELVLDVGASAGVTENQVVDLWRPLKLKHPVTGKVITDRFKIGQVQIGQVRPNMSLAKAMGTLARDAAPGDLIFIRRAAVSSAVVSTPVSTPSPTDTQATREPVSTGEKMPADATPYDEPQSPSDVDAKHVTEMFDAMKGQSVAMRIARYEQFLRQHPDTRFAQVLYEEALALRQLMTRPAVSTQSASPMGPVLVHGPGPINAAQGQPVRVEIEVSGAVRGTVFHLRKKGDTLYVPTPMKWVGRGYFAVEIPAAQVTDRTLEYFIEAVGPEESVTIVGSSRTPEEIQVVPTPPVRVPPSGRSSFSVLADVADYNRLRGNDYAYQVEGVFGIRFKDLGIRAVRMGFGVYRGVSGTIAELDEQGLSGREVGLTYGSLEGEFGVHKYFSLITRLSVGLLDNGVSGGGQLLARIGNDQGTNLKLGGEVLGGIGLRSIIELELNTFPRFPILLRTEVTNQPAGFGGSNPSPLPDTAVGTSDVAGRGIVQLGFRPVPELLLALRGSFQGRNINHAGPGIGGSVGYTW